MAETDNQGSPGLNPPDAAVLQAIVLRFAPDARVVAASRMDGGESATMTSIRMERAGGKQDTVVLRQAGDRSLRTAPGTVVNEARVLDALEGTGLPVPRALDV